MLPDLIDSFLRPGAYRRFAEEKSGRTARYIAFLSLIFVAAIGVSVKIRLAPLFTETFAWLETKMPAIEFAGGGATSTAAGPTRIEHPRLSGVAVMIDTTRKDPVTPAQMADAKVLAYLTNTALYLDRGQGRIEAIDLSKSVPDRPVKIDAGTYKDMERAFDWVFYPSLLLFFFLAFAASLGFCGLLYALIGMAMASFAHGALTFGRLFRIAVHAQTAGSLLYALDALLPIAIPLLPFLSAALSLVFLWRGVRAAAASSAEPPVPAA